MKLKVVHLIDSLEHGGAEMMLFKLLSRMDQKRFENVVISMMPLGTVGERVRALGVPVHLLGMRRGRPSLSGFVRLARLLHCSKPAVLQTWMANADLAGLVTGRFTGLRCVVWNIRDSIVGSGECSRLTSLAKRACAWLSGWPRAVVTNSEAGRRTHERLGYRPREWSLIPNGFDLSAFRPDAIARGAVRRELKVPEEAWLIGIVGRDHTLKDHATFLRAGSLLHSRKPHVHFVMVGQGLSAKNNAISSLAPGLLKDRVLHLLGARVDVECILAAIDVFALTSLCEGFPNVIGEAMACGVPCIVTETAGDAPVIVGDTGVIVPAQDARMLANAFQELVNEGHDKCAARGVRARKRIEDRYSLDSVTRSYESLYTRLVAAKPLPDSIVQRCLDAV